MAPALPGNTPHPGLLFAKSLTKNFNRKPKSRLRAILRESFGQTFSKVCRVWDGVPRFFNMTAPY